MNNKSYSGHSISDYNLIVPASRLYMVKALFLIIILLTLCRLEVNAEDRSVSKEDATTFVYDEIPVRVVIEGVGGFYLSTLYSDENLFYVNIQDLFHTLKIQCIEAKEGDSLSGFINNESRAYGIDYDAKLIKVGPLQYNTRHLLQKETGALYLESSLLAEAFGITLTFNFRSFTCILKSDFELPLVKQLRIEKLQSNMSKVKGEVIADTVLKRNYHLFKPGTLDWSVASFQKWNEPTDNRFGLGIGTELLYGEADISVNYYNRQKFDSRQLQYLWRWVDNDKKIIRQAQAGKISNQSISFINAPVIGAVIRNSPTIVRKATGYYLINEYTEPDWTVELYINNVMVDYTKADASGLYLFKVPIVYGYTTLKLKFYGPMGEERIEERTINTPYNIMPVNEFEYGLSAGIVQDSIHSRFGRGEFNYGVNSRLTVGGGLEYLSSIPTGALIPFAKATIQPFNKLTLNAEYAYGVRTRGLLNYYFGKSAVLEIDYAKYAVGQRATIFNAKEERKVKLSLPLRYKQIAGYFKFNYAQLLYGEFNYNQGGIMLSANYKQFNANSSLQLNWIDQRTPYATSDLALSYRMKNGFSIRPSVQYNVSEGRLNTCQAEIEKRISKAYLSVSYQRNISYNDNSINLSFKYDLPFARTNASFSHSKGNTTTSESVQGSLAFGGGNNYLHASNNSSVSKGGILLYPFLDLNQNGIFDKGEPMVKLTTVRISGGRALFNEKDSIVRIPDLNAFTNYILEFQDNDLETVAWRFKNKIYQVLIDPNQFKRIDIPVISVGEVSGMAYRETDNSLKGIGRIWIKFYKKNSTKVVAETLSESDGYIYYLGLEPGEYVARIDSLQLSNLDFTADPVQIDFVIKPMRDGDIVDGIDFVLRPVQNDDLKKEIMIMEPGIEVPANTEKNIDF